MLAQNHFNVILYSANVTSVKLYKFTKIKRQLFLRTGSFRYCFIAAAKLRWLKLRANDRKTADSMPVLGITSLCLWIFNANFLAGSCMLWKTTQVSTSKQQAIFSCGVEDSAGVCFTTAYAGKKNEKTSGYGTSGISESGSGLQLPYV